jgi:hypothetical protein
MSVVILMRLRLRDFEILAYLLDEYFLDFTVSWNS